LITYVMGKLCREDHKNAPAFFVLAEVS